MSGAAADSLDLADDAGTPLEHASKRALAAAQGTRCRTGRFALSVAS
jgi:hypothetical protein